MLSEKHQKRTDDNLRGVHPDLVRVFKRASEIHPDPDPICTEGLRTVARQHELVKKGASQTMRSRHITGHAIDIAFIIDGVVRWDQPLYGKFSNAMKQAANELGLKIEWGGDWKSFVDSPHFQLPWDKYPA